MSHDRFQRVSWWRKGYHCRQVEAFLRRCELSWRGGAEPLAPADVRRAGFELVRRGYQPAAVDAALDRLEERALADQGVAVGRRARVDPASEVEYLRNELAAPYMRRFRRAHLFRRGYDVDDVDEFVDRVSSALDGGGLTPHDVRSAAFRPKWGGYAEDAVDEALDRVVELLLSLSRHAEPAADPLPARPMPSSPVLRTPPRA